MLSVYKISNNINKWVYIGITTREPNIRWKEHLYGAKKKNGKLYRAMRKHGTENFSFEVVAQLKGLQSKDIIFEVEKEYIKNYNSYWFGYNNTTGGKGIVRPKRKRKE